MWAWVKQVLTVPELEDEDQTRAAAVLNTILLICLAATILFPIALVVFEPTTRLPIYLIFAGVGITVLVSVVLLRQGYVQLVGTVLPSVLWIGFTASMYIYDGIRDTGVGGHFLVLTLVGLVLSMRVLLVFALASVLAFVGAYVLEMNGILVSQFEVLPSLIDPIVIVTTYVVSALLLRVARSHILEGFARARSSAQALAERNRALQESSDALEAQTRQLVRRTAYLEASGAVTREASTMLGDPQALLQRVASLISEHFGFYHAGLFLLDPGAEWAILQAASSEGGERMLARGHRLRVGQQGIVGWVSYRGTPRVALDVGEDAMFFDNPDLPDTRSEVALPLRARGQILGVLDVQSIETEAFHQEDVAVLQAFADQVAVAIDNAQLYRRVEEIAEAERRLRGQFSQRAWESILQERRSSGYVKERGEIVPAAGALEPEMRAALETGQAASGAGGTLAVPVRVGEQIVAVVDVQLPEGTDDWTSEQVSMIETLSTQLGQALDRARLYEDTQRSAGRERMVARATERMRESLELEDVLRVAADEMRQALRLEEVVVRLRMEEMDGGPAPGLPVTGREGMR